MTNKRTYKQQALTQLLIVLAIIATLNVLSSSFFLRMDITEDKRFTLTDSTKKLLHNLKDVVFVKVYLTGDMPPDYKRLSLATKEFLDEMKVYGKDKIQYKFEDPTKGKSREEKEKIYQELSEKGLQPTIATKNSDDPYATNVVVPGAIIYFKGKEFPVSLVYTINGRSSQPSLNNSIAQLENTFSEAIEQLSLIRKSKIGFIRGQGELPDYNIADFVSALSFFYNPEWIDVENEVRISKDYSTLIIAKPTTTFSEKDKFKIDQYIMNGGKVLWLIDVLNAEFDSLARRGSMLTYDYPLNLDDQLFRYGVRINPDLIMDLQCSPIPVPAKTYGGKQQYQYIPFTYFPILSPNAAANNPIGGNVDAVQAKFVNSIDTLALKTLKKTVLLKSSGKSRIVFTPWLIDLRELQNEPNISEFNKKNQIAAVLLEGTFPSVFQNRVTKEMETLLRDSLKQPFNAESVTTKMIVISDGDIIRNGVNQQGIPFSLGYYPITGDYFGNKNFLLNCVDYLAGYSQHITTRSKTIGLRLLDEPKIKESKLKWQLINIFAPLGALLIFGFIFNFIRIRKFAR
ncbi:MAG TPA: gliding motility-associated ABC transporter substrate-binding protein GldG [Chitinophagales bacterium]|nr:gliding motility-associated ABC transporter substrate-binding protein GldG [Chitinophagales bacterium]